MQEALKTGDPLLMSAIMNPYNESTASQGIGGIDAYGYERRNEVGNNGGIQFSPAAGNDKGKQYTMGPTELDKDVVISEDSPLSGQLINTAEGPIRVSPDSMQSQNYGEGSPNQGPDKGARSQAEIDADMLNNPQSYITDGRPAVQDASHRDGRKQQRSGSALRFLARQRSGSRMRLLKQGRRL